MLFLNKKQPHRALFQKLTLISNEMKFNTSKIDGIFAHSILEVSGNVANKYRLERVRAAGSFQEVDNERHTH